MIVSTCGSLEGGITELACFHDVKRLGWFSARSWSSGKFLQYLRDWRKKERSSHVFLTFKAMSRKSHLPFLV